MSKHASSDVELQACQQESNGCADVLSELLRTAVGTGDEEEVAKVMFLHQDEIQERVLPDTSENGHASDQAMETNEIAELFDAGWGIINEWKKKLQKGDSVDFFRPQELKWYAAKILERDSDEVKLHYDGWNSKFDDSGVSLSDAIMYPKGTAVKRRKPAAKKEKMQVFEYVTVPRADYENNASHDAVENLDRSSRRSRARSFMIEQPKKPVKRQKTKEEENKEDADKREWVCSICHQLEAPDDSDLILCDGLCKRSFHLMCLDLPEAEKKRMLEDDSEWWCDECLAGRHACFICGDEGEDHVEVIKCSQSNCGKFYHYNCITTQSAPYSLKRKAKQVTEATDSNSKSDRQSVSSSASTDSDRNSRNSEVDSIAYRKKRDEGFSQFQLKCPHHFCDNCHNLYGSDNPPKYGKGKNLCLHRCFRCPRAFHLNCIPPTSRHNPHTLLCPNHPTEVLPTFEPLKGNIENHGGVYTYLWDQFVLPLRPPRANDITDNNHFRILCSMVEEINSKPPSFKLIWSNDYEPLSKNDEEMEFEDGASSKVQIPLHIPDERCECIDECGEHCLNRVSKIECYEKTPKESICNVGKDCGNRHFTNREYVKVQPFQENGMGWGLKAKEDVPAGTLVIEYIGEIITEAQMIRRMTLQTSLTPHDRDFYIMELSNGLFVDGKRKGNLSRFINHSCDPNCELVRWVVKGRTRIGIFAVKDIAADEPLSYDYQFDTQDADTFQCACGAATCRGTMAPKKKVLDKDSLTKKELKKLIAAGKRRENKEASKEREWKRSYTSKMLPGDGILEVKNGPPKNTFKSARDMKLFLPRNAMKSTNISRRRMLMWAHSPSS